MSGQLRPIEHTRNIMTQYATPLELKCRRNSGASHIIDAIPRVAKIHCLALTILLTQANSSSYKCGIACKI